MGSMMVVLGITTVRDSGFLGPSSALGAANTNPVTIKSINTIVIVFFIEPPFVWNQFIPNIIRRICMIITPRDFVFVKQKVFFICNNSNKTFFCFRICAIFSFVSRKLTSTVSADF
jgi:hypothetical protein